VNKTVDSDFLALPLAAVSDAAISTAKDAGASHVDVRIERTRSGLLSLREVAPRSRKELSEIVIAGLPN
jgi:TldD protein